MIKSSVPLSSTTSKMVDDRHSIDDPRSEGDVIKNICR